MAELKTKPTDVSPDDFLAAVEPESRRLEGERVLAIMREVTGEPGTMWGPTMVGFGTVEVTYASGRKLDWMRIGFSPRKAQFTFYGLRDHPDSLALLERLGPFTHGRGCVYVKRLSDLDEGILREAIAVAFDRAGGPGYQP